MAPTADQVLGACRELHTASTSTAREYVDGFDSRVRMDPLACAIEVATAAKGGIGSSLSAILLAEAYREILELREELANLRAESDPPVWSP